MKNNLVKQNELMANVYVAKAMSICAAFAVLAIILNSVGVFVIKQSVMVTSCVGSIIILMVPTFILYLLKKNETWLKYVAIVGSCVFVLGITTALNIHVVVLFIFPMALASIYFNPALSRLALILSVIASTAGKALAYALQTVPDKNFSGWKSLAIYSFFPHILMLTCVGLIFISLAKNTGGMLNSLLGAEEQEKMYLHMKELTDQSAEVSMGLLKEMETLTSVTRDTMAANHQISENTEIVIAGIDHSMKQLKDAEGSSRQIYEDIQSMNDGSEAISELFSNIEKLSDQNRSYMQNVTTGMVKANESTDICQRAMHNLEEKTRKIDGIVNVIADISEQTDLLSLNAAIESARAGEQGKGFAIVAEEIRKLSQQTQNTLLNIRTIIEELMEQNDIAVEAMSQTTQVHDEQKEVILKAESSSQQVMEATKNMAARMNLILDNTKNIEKSASKIVDIVENITAICNENQISLEAVSDSVQSGVTYTRQLEELVHSIHEISDQLTKAIEEN